MNKKEFTEMLRVEIAMNLPPSMEDSSIETTQVTGFNKTSYDALTIVNDSIIAAPAINIDRYYSQFNQGRPMDDIIKEIIAMNVEQNVVLDKMDLRRFASFDQARDYITVRICSEESNRDYLKDAVIKDFGDFKATYHMALNISDEAMLSAVITPSILNQWGVSIEDVHQAAMDNMKPSMAHINNVVEALMFGEKPTNLLEENVNYDSEDLQMGAGLFVISNGKNFFGASTILNEDVLKQVCQICGCSGYILPSSVHECLFVPEQDGIELKDLTDMVRDVNGSEVAPEDRLSDNVQFVDKDTGKFMNAELHEQLQQEKTQEQNKSKSGPELKGPSL